MRTNYEDEGGHNSIQCNPHLVLLSVFSQIDSLISVLSIIHCTD